MDLERKKRVDEFFAEIDDLPTLPYIVIQLLNKLHEPEPNLDELVELVMTDQVLTTQMIKLVNSAFFGLNKEVKSVKSAILYLGFREINNLIYTVSLTNTFERDVPLLKRVRFWEHSFGCALISKIIAQKVGYPDSETAYLSGLLHDIGETIIALNLPQEFEKVVEKVMDENITFFQAEEEILKINHTNLGYWLIANWRMPTKIADVIASHHHIETAIGDPTLVAIVRFADLICLYHQLDFGYTEGESITTEIIEIWRILSKSYPKLDNIKLRPYLDEFNDHIETVKKTVAKVYSNEKEAVTT